ncbi:sugar ABC transporter ATP-binding protein [Falseniella ignava]|uniref:ABC transporter domain-containing protein n=1 Tax=Falseniella ignava CCUG 37419 TaxID=883112 RepID=K1M0F7_9LACT|nr:sugar ABC transporter ATP-binding protein [Falseniella ignava]EKB55793.1 hypothetical protein HMPREF9707_00980 [Falseniella ignava CCUG 37419]
MVQKFISMENICKNFGGVKALKGASLQINKGEVHCLAGENGSGKSTIIKVLSGVHKPESGKIIIDDQEYTEMKPSEAIKQGIQIIYQDFSIFPNLTVRENLALNKILLDGKKLVTKKDFDVIAKEAIAKIGFEVDLDELVENLSVADKQLVAISRALLDDAKLIVMDEPTTALTKKEVDRLFDIIRRLVAEDVTILFVSHKLDEVFEICDRITVFRNGENVITLPISDMTEEKFSFYMTGRDLKYEQSHYEKNIGDTVLELKGLTGKNFSDIDFSIKKGEIVGITGHLGNGRSELTQTLFGLLQPTSGEVYIDGEKVIIENPKRAQDLGIALVPEDRLTEGLFLPMSIKTNATAAMIDKYANSLGIINRKKVIEKSREAINQFSIATTDEDQAVGALSGGNQQKVLLSRWIDTQPKILILNGPTAGVDIGAKHDIYKVLKTLSLAGVAIIIGSDDMREITQNCDRVEVMTDGKIITTLQKEELTPEILSNYM